MILSDRQRLALCRFLCLLCCAAGLWLRAHFFPASPLPADPVFCHGLSASDNLFLLLAAFAPHCLPFLIVFAAGITVFASPAALLLCLVAGFTSPAYFASFFSILFVTAELILFSAQAADAAASGFGRIAAAPGFLSSAAFRRYAARLLVSEAAVFHLLLVRELILYYFG